MNSEEIKKVKELLRASHNTYQYLTKGWSNATVSLEAITSELADAIHQVFLLDVENLITKIPDDKPSDKEIIEDVFQEYRGG